VSPIRTLLYCHHDAPLHREGYARWLATSSTLVGIVVIRDSRRTRIARLRRQLRRAGPIGAIDAVLLRVHYRLTRQGADAEWEARQLDDLRRRYPADLAGVPVLEVDDPNGASAEAFVRDCRPDLAIALSKHLLRERLFSIPRHGTFVLHPGICPEYRNAHGCFWALVNDDATRVGLTLLRIDKGIDTGPIFGYFTVDYTAALESFIRLQVRASLENLAAIWSRLEEVVSGHALPIDVRGRQSAAWGQPTLSAWLRWRRSVKGGSRALRRA
jgi:hypothetical protein